MNLPALAATGWTDYELLDSGSGRKLERFGPIVLDRPEAQATWQPALPRRDWQAAHALFQDGPGEGRWVVQPDVARRWSIGYHGLRCSLEIDRSRHVGVFPENAVHWDWIEAQVASAGRPLHLINLFGYTGLATLAAARAGARVTHVDASKRAVTRARENLALSGLADRPVRWIVEDALKYLGREARRGVRYDGIIMDPPAFGRGPGGEVWSFERLFGELCSACRSVLSGQPRLVVATLYTRSADFNATLDALAAMMAGQQGQLTAGRMVTRDHSDGREIEHGQFVRWLADDAGDAS
ncbi:MAG: class I SAM-dependent methyltransferase [Caldilineales bacterium]